MPKNITPIFLPSRAPKLNPVENVWQYLRQNWLSNRAFDSYDAIIDAACEAWHKLIATPETITSNWNAGVGACRSNPMTLGTTWRSGAVGVLDGDLPDGTSPRFLATAQ